MTDQTPNSKIPKILEAVFRYGIGTNSDDIRGNDTAYFNLQITMEVESYE